MLIHRPIIPRRRGGYSRDCLGSLCVAIIAAAGIGAAPIASAADDNIGAWAVFTTTDAFPSDGGASRWHYWLDAQARYFDIGSGINQYLVRPAIGYDLRGSVQVWAGYARFRSRNRVGRVADENRAWQQLNWTAGRWGGGTVSMRVRLLQRSVNVGDDLGLVLRVLTRYTRPIGLDGKQSLILGVEPFFDLRDTDWSGSSGIAQNRTYIGIGWRLRDDLTVDTGYMNQFVWSDQGEDTSNHLGVVNFKVRF